MNTAQSLLSLSNLTLTRNSMAVVTDGHLAVNRGEIVCLVGPNGSGKTSLVELLAGSSPCTVSSGSIMFTGNSVAGLAATKYSDFFLEKDLLVLTSADRARHGLYVAFQQVPEFEGVTAETFLFEAYAACSGLRPKRDDFKIKLVELCAIVGLSVAHLERPLFKGFSGGERKRFQLLELLLLRPQLAVLDELDAGLDTDGLALFFNVIKQLQTENPVIGFLVITHNDTVFKKLMPQRCYELFNSQLKERVI